MGLGSTFKNILRWFVRLIILSSQIYVQQMEDLDWFAGETILDKLG